MFEEFSPAHLTIHIRKEKNDTFQEVRQNLHADVRFTSGDWRTIETTLARTPESSFCYNGSLDNFALPLIPDDTMQRLFHLLGFTVYSMKQDFFICDDSPYRVPRHTIVFTLSGHGQLFAGGRTIRLARGDGFFLNRMSPVRYESLRDRWKFIHLEIGGPLTGEIYNICTASHGPVFHMSNPDEFLDDLSAILKVYSTSMPYRDYHASSRIDAMLSRLIAAFEENHSGNSDTAQMIRYLIRYIDSNYTQPLSVEFLSQFSSISRSHLTKLFRKYTGFAPNEYIIRLRISHAKRMLLSTDESVADIAYACGFNDINNFINLFKKHTSETPGAYRRKHVL